MDTITNQPFTCGVTQLPYKSAMLPVSCSSPCFLNVCAGSYCAQAPPVLARQEVRLSGQIKDAISPSCLRSCASARLLHRCSVGLALPNPGSALARRPTKRLEQRAH